MRASVDLIPDLPDDIPNLAKGAYPTVRRISNYHWSYGIPDELSDYMHGASALTRLTPLQRNQTREVYNMLVRRYGPVANYATVGFKTLDRWYDYVLFDGPVLVTRYYLHTLGANPAGYKSTFLEQERHQIARIVGLVMVDRNWTATPSQQVQAFVRSMLRGNSGFATTPQLADLLEEEGCTDYDYLNWMRVVPADYWCRVSYFMRWGLR